MADTAVATPMANATLPTANDLLNMSDADLAKSIDATPKEWTNDGKGGEKIATTEPEGAKSEPSKPDAPKPEAQPEETQDASGYFQDEAGKWHRPDGQFANGVEIEAINASLGPDATAAPVAADPGTEPVAPAPKRDFEILSPDGKAVDAVPDVKLKFTADGKEREASVEQLVRLAKMGYYNERREQEVQTTKQMSAQSLQQMQALQSALQERDLLIERYMADPGYRDAALNEYQRLNSPEVRLQRLHQEREQEQQSQAAQQRFAAAAGYITNTLTPRVEAIQGQYPQVTQEEILGRMTLLTGDLTVNGTVPLEYLPEVERRIEADLRPWAEQRHASRETTIATERTNARRQVEAAKVQAAMAKRQLARAANGLNNGQVAPNTPPVPSKPKSADEWMEQMFGKDDR